MQAIKETCLVSFLYEMQRLDLLATCTSPHVLSDFVSIRSGVAIRLRIYCNSLGVLEQTLKGSITSMAPNASSCKLAPAQRHECTWSSSCSVLVNASGMRTRFRAPSAVAIAPGDVVD